MSILYWNTSPKKLSYRYVGTMYRHFRCIARTFWTKILVQYFYCTLYTSTAFRTFVLDKIVQSLVTISETFDPTTIEQVATLKRYQMGVGHNLSLFRQYSPYCVFTMADKIPYKFIAGTKSPL